VSDATRQRDYKETLNLPRTAFPMRANLPQREPETLARWLEPDADGNVGVGDIVLAIGNPFGLGGTVTAGIVSAQGRDIGSGPYDYMQIDAAVNRAVAAGLENYDLSTALPHVRAPSLVIYGASDRVVQPAYQLEFRGRLLTARFVEFQESGHFPFLEEPDPFARVVHYFAAHGGR